VETTNYADFAERLAEHKRAVAAAAVPLLRQVGDALPRTAFGALQRTTRMLESTLEELGSAEAELRAQNEDLFAARTELEARGELYRSFFELAPLAYVVSDVNGVIRHVNRASSALFRRPVNGLVGKPLAVYVELGEREAFRAGLTRVVTGGMVERWPVRFDARANEFVDVDIVARAAPNTPDGRTLIHWTLIPSPAGVADLH
jgi:PAS domain-containing protein